MPFLAIILGFVRTPLGMRVIGALAALVALAWIYHKIKGSGYDEAIQQIERQDSEARDRAKSGGDRVRDCYDRGPEWLWDVARGDCRRSEGRSGG